MAECGMLSLHRCRKRIMLELCFYAMQGTPFCYRFRVPPNKDIVIKDQIRGDVKFNTNALGDFVILRSNGLPVYNFCVAIDDALMRITHVIRAVSLAMRLHLIGSAPAEGSCWSGSAHRVHGACFADAHRDSCLGSELSHGTSAHSILHRRVCVCSAWQRGHWPETAS